MNALNRIISSVRNGQFAVQARTFVDRAVNEIRRPNDTRHRLEWKAFLMSARLKLIDRFS